jgi:hypothetical protein
LSIALLMRVSLQEYTAGRRNSTFVQIGIPIDIRRSQIDESSQKVKIAEYVTEHFVCRHVLFTLEVFRTIMNTKR